MPEHKLPGTVPPDRSTILGLKQNTSVDRIVTLDSQRLTPGDIERALKRIQTLDKLSNESILLDINSRGGPIDNSLRFYRALKTIRSPILGFVNGSCESSAILCLLGCKYRSATANSIFHTHEIVFRLPLVLRSSDIREDTHTAINKHYAYLDEKNTELLHALSESTGTLPELWKGIIRSALHMPSSDALQLGLIHEVI